MSAIYKNGVIYSNDGSGSSMHEYSTEEHVVGTWIDGKPIYEKTIVFDNYVGYGDMGSNQNANISSLNIDTIIFMDAEWNQDNRYHIGTLSCGGIDGKGLFVRTNDWQIFGVGAFSTRYIIIQYTKTTD